MRLYEKHPLHKRAYIAYDAQGFAFLMTGYKGNYMARPSHAGQASDLRMLFAATLRELSEKVAASKQA